VGEPPVALAQECVGAHLLSDDEARFVDLGSDYYESRVNLNRRTRNHVRELQALGYEVTLEPAA